MATRAEALVNDRAGRLANGAIELLTQNGVENAVVWVAHPASEKWPLAIRNNRNDGFWGVGLDAYLSFQLLAKNARRQVDYARTVAGRTAIEQAQKCKETNRGVTSYGYALRQNLEPGFVVDDSSQLTVVGVASGIDALKMVNIVTRAVADVEGGRKPKMTEAGKWLHACFSLLESKLESGMSGIAMLALPEFIHKFATDFDPGPVIVATQTVGESVDVPKFSIVGAKVMCTAVTGKPSGTLDGDDVYRHSNIRGALPVRFGEYGYRVAAIGGLKDIDDVKTLRDVADGEVGRRLNMTILDEIPKK